MILSLLLSFLHLVALVLVVRLTLPPRYFFANPYCLAIDTLTTRLLNTLRSAIPLAPKPLCLLTLVLVLAVRATLSTKLGLPTLELSSFAIAKYDVTHFGGWFGVEVLRFAGFYLALLTANTLLRFWHRGQPLPGYSGNMLLNATRPFSFLSLPKQTVGILLLTFAYVSIVLATATTIESPLAQVRQFQDAITQANLPNLFASNTSPLLRLMLLTGTILLETLAAIQNTIFILILMLLVTMLTGSGPLAYFLNDVKNLLCGWIPPIRLGKLDFSLPVLFIVLGLLIVVLTFAFLLMMTVLAYVV